MKNRKAIEEKAIELIREFYPDEDYLSVLASKMKAMSDERFIRFIKNKELKVISSPMKPEPKLSSERCLKFLIKHNRNPWKRLVMVHDKSGLEFSPAKTYLVLPVPIKRVVQTLYHKRSIPTTQTHIDQRTDQPTGPSKGSRMSNTEALIINSQGDGYPNTLKEYYKVRGGDNRALNAANKLIIAQGTASHSVIDTLGSRPKAVKVLGTYLTAQHYDNNV